MKLWPIGKKREAGIEVPLLIEKRVSNRDQRNEYLLLSDTEAAMIDVSDTTEEMLTLLSRFGQRLRYLFVTHAHPSHLRSLRALKQSHDASFCLHPYDYELLKAFDGSLEPDVILKDNALLPLGSSQIRVLHTPGHTKGSVCFYVKKAQALFSGNTLLAGKHGRIWNGNSMSLMLFSLKRLNYTVPSRATVYPGRGAYTSLGKEAWVNCLRSA